MLIIDLDIELMADATGHKPSGFLWFLCKKELFVFPTGAVKREDLIFWRAEMSSVRQEGNSATSSGMLINCW